MYLLYKRLGVDTPVCVMCEFAQTSMRSITYLITVLCKEKFARFSGSFGSTVEPRLSGHLGSRSRPDK